MKTLPSAKQRELGDSDLMPNSHLEGNVSVMKPREHILGFDAREMTWLPNVKWDTARVAKFLIRKDVWKVLSVDHNVWPTVFDTFFEKELKLYTSSHWRSGYDLWSTIPDLLNDLKDKSCDPYWIIAITLILDPLTETEQQLWINRLGSISPDTVQSAWAFLGYDVADTYLLSGLSNCGHPASDSQWASSLNQYHLFSDLEKAGRYKSIDDENIQHNPFWVYGIYLVSIQK